MTPSPEKPFEPTPEQEVNPCRKCGSIRSELQEYSGGPTATLVWHCVTCLLCGFTAEAAPSNTDAIKNWNASELSTLRSQVKELQKMVGLYKRCEQKPTDFGQESASYNNY